MSEACVTSPSSPGVQAVVYEDLNNVRICFLKTNHDADLAVGEYLGKLSEDSLPVLLISMPTHQISYLTQFTPGHVSTDHEWKRVTREELVHPVDKCSQGPRCYLFVAPEIAGRLNARHRSACEILCDERSGIEIITDLRPKFFSFFAENLSSKRFNR
jgi:hypothetical protein